MANARGSEISVWREVCGWCSLNVPTFPTLMAFEAPGNTLHETIRAINTMAEKVYFTCPTEQSVDVAGKDSPQDEKIQFHWNDGDEITITKPPADPSAVNGIYSVDYLKDIFKALKSLEAAPHEIAMAAAEMENKMNAGEFYPDKGTQTRFD